jgi:hypothetical protein
VVWLWCSPAFASTRKRVGVIVTLRVHRLGPMEQRKCAAFMSVRRGTVKLMRIVRQPFFDVGSALFLANARDVVPHKEGAGSQHSVVNSP